MKKYTNKQLEKMIQGFEVFKTEKDYSIDEQNWFEDGLTSRVKNTTEKVSNRKLISIMARLQKEIKKANDWSLEHGFIDSLRECTATYDNCYWFSSLGKCSRITEEQYSKIYEIYLSEIQG